MFACSPVLIVAFNRPAFTVKVINALRSARPSQLFFAVDGPRPHCPADVESCALTRALVSQIDWPCDLHTLFHEGNKGCKYAPPDAITWFFRHVPAGIILEDDCVPTHDFLHFSSDLLSRYSADDRIGMITGDNHFHYQTDSHVSYHFSRYSSIWGWATWSRAWNLYDVEMKRYSEHLDTIRASLGHSVRFRNYWWRHVTAVQKGMNTWDIQWAVALLANRKLIIRPKCNLVSNIGFACGSTHTCFEFDAHHYMSTASLTFPLAHPDVIALDDPADRKLEARIVSYWRRGLTWIGSKSSLARALLMASTRRLSVVWP